MKPLVYILEDDVDISNVVQRTLKAEGFLVEVFQRKGSFLNQFKRKAPDLCLVDLTLPDGDGLSVITENLHKSGVPAIVVTGKSAVTDRIIGLEVGADDYITKPFEPRELVARVRAVLRRIRLSGDQAAAGPQRVAQFDDWTADLQSCTLIHASGAAVDLGAAETRLLEVLLKSAGRVLSRGQLMDHIHSSDEEPLDRSVDARISRLRKRLGDDPKDPRLVRTVYGAGYVFSAKVEWV
ncbi:DNA-binding response regulator [Actibacterium atlanticum]|uniref:DNA-binding response regulator n=1 Tax=Actibacterium atlanticum TaxID=1461693 RepID=A0A058ZKZ0_9RHOB|nr:response regulator transcription factor [Actibacterium atlanticum]KCV81890.1 DNA-binding response regulator [Actibacterium atlanticum]